MSVPHFSNTAVVGNVISGAAALVSWTDIRDDLSIAASLMAIIVGAITIWRTLKSPD